MSNQTDQNKEQNQSEEIGAFWKRQAKSSGQTYLSGTIKVDELGVEKVMNVVVFSNNHKTKDNQPDYRVYKSKSKEELAQQKSTQGKEPKAKEEEFAEELI